MDQSWVKVLMPNNFAGMGVSSGPPLLPGLIGRVSLDYPGAVVRVETDCRDNAPGNRGRAKETQRVAHGDNLRARLNRRRVHERQGPEPIAGGTATNFQHRQVLYRIKSLQRGGIACRHHSPGPQSGLLRLPRGGWSEHSPCRLPVVSNITPVPFPKSLVSIRTTPAFTCSTMASRLGVGGRRRQVKVGRGCSRGDGRGRRGCSGNRRWLWAMAWLWGQRYGIVCRWCRG